MEEIVAENQTLWDKNYEKYVVDVLRRGKTGKSLPRECYNILNVYSLVSIGSVAKVTKRNGKYMATKEEVINIIFSMHIATGHGGEKKTHKKIQDKFANIPRYLVQEYIKRCERCVEKRARRETASDVVIRPLTVKDLNERGQVDLVNMQTIQDGNFRFILHYMEYLTKFHVIRPQQRKTATEVANQLLLISRDFGAPNILQSDNGREFTGQVIQELSTLWPELFLVNGRPRHPQSQGSVERSNGDMKTQLMAWMRDNSTSKWSYGIRFVQWSMNTSYHEATGMEPYKAMTGNRPRCGLKSILPTDFLDKIFTGILEEDLEIQICEVENGDVNSNNPETIVSPGNDNPDAESNHLPPSMAESSLDNERTHLLQWQNLHWRMKVFIYFHVPQLH
ncbi:KRAB-A domain-containing protein 2-like [Oopsacas minuta]|uniref:KRAB-A domain-containing protein 2-like n=1 Tax=Oopsacas minuta TaxID=111878 RepID=A0AAV7JLE3_9METZ|nr:KRAB-A domain-containing protein 2-like [Oopsacas minuta]